jgi:polysaccharide export outer membrane protein
MRSWLDLARSTALACTTGIVGIVAAGSMGCAGPGEYVWFQSMPVEATQATNEYVIGVGDLLSIRVLGREEMTLKQRVRTDGRIALFLIGDVEARGKRPSALKAELEGRLKDYIVSPSVVVNVDEAQPFTVLVLGEVAHPGAFQLEQDPRLSHAIAMAGGLSDYAARDGIFVVRSTPRPVRIRFTFDAIRRNTGGAADFLLHWGDLVEVE